jgi:UDP-N-acetylmuramoylalanine--D-glutamate ligase
MNAVLENMNRETSRQVIVGLGTTGLSVARYLSRSGQGFALVDSRREPPGIEELKRDFPGIEAHFGDFNTPLLSGAEKLIVSPGISVHTPEIAEAVSAGAEVLGDIELFARAVKSPVIAITGSNGKSTVTALVGEMARAAGIEVGVGGNIGTPALDLLENEAYTLYVLELSSFQLETTRSLQPVASVVLNLSADHMDRYTDLAAYARAKARIYHQADHCIVNRDDAQAMALAECSEQISFGLDAPQNDRDYGLCDLDGEDWLVRGEEPLMKASEIRIAGRHNTANVLAAMALAEVSGIPMTAAIEAARTFAGLPHRCEWVGEADGVSWFNDSKGTNIGATLAALNGLQQPVVLIAGGQGKGADFSELRAGVRDKARAVILYGEDAALIEQAIGDEVPVVRVRDLAGAVARARELSRSGDAVLFSPACASFDMFRDYQHRGETFVALVREALS